MAAMSDYPPELRGPQFTCDDRNCGECDLYRNLYDEAVAARSQLVTRLQVLDAIEPARTELGECAHSFRFPKGR